MRQQQTSGPSFMESYAFVQWGMKFPALTLMILTRNDIGYRLLTLPTIIAVFGLLAILTVLATPGHEAAHPEHLLIFAGVGFISGLVQKIRRWCDLNRGVIRHSYYIGTSRLDFPWLPHFVRRNRRVARYGEPILFAGIGLALLPYSHDLGLFLISMRDAGRQIRLALTAPVEQLSKRIFINAWCSVAYLFPGLHPDGFEDPDSGWPPVLRRFAAEAWRRADAGELDDDELYASDAQWSGLYDRMFVHMPDETERRLKLAATFGQCADA